MKIKLLFLSLFFLAVGGSLQAAPGITVSATAVTLLGTSQQISITVQLIDPNNTGMLKVSGTGIVPIMRASTVTPGTTATVGPIYGNDVILDGYGNSNTTYYQVQVFTYAAPFVSSTPVLQNFYAFVGSGTVDLATATPLAPSFMSGPGGSVLIPGSLTVNGTLNSNSLNSGNVANKPATADAVRYVTAGGNDANDGLSYGTAKATFAAAYSTLPTCTPQPSNNGTSGTFAFSAPCGTIYLGAHATSATDGYLISATVNIPSAMVRIVGIDKLGTQIQCQTISPCIQFSMGNSAGAGHAGGTVTAGPSPVMSAHGGLENLTIIGSSTANQIGVNCLDCTGAVFKDLRLSGFTGTGATEMELQNDLDGISERIEIDNVAFENGTNELVATASGASLVSFNHQYWHHVQFTLANGQTALTISGFAQWSGYIDGVVNSVPPNTNTSTRLSILNSATFKGFDGTINDFVGTLTDCSGCTSTNFSTWGHAPNNNGTFSLLNNLIAVSNFGGSSGLQFQNNAATAIGSLLVPDGNGCANLWTSSLSRQTFVFGCAAGSTAGLFGIGGVTSGFTGFQADSAANGTIAVHSPVATGEQALTGYRTSVAGSTTLLAANSCGDTVTVTVTGATTSMDAHASGTISAGLIERAWVSAANTVSVQYCNVTAAGITPSAATLQVTVTQ